MSIERCEALLVAHDEATIFWPTKMKINTSNTMATMTSTSVMPRVLLLFVPPTSLIATSFFYITHCRLGPSHPRPGSNPPIHSNRDNLRARRVRYCVFRQRDGQV